MKLAFHFWKANCSAGSGIGVPEMENQSCLQTLFTNLLKNEQVARLKLKKRAKVVHSSYGTTRRRIVVELFPYCMEQMG